VGDVLVAKGRVIKAGKTLTIARGDVYGIMKDDDKEIHIATALVTLMTMESI
jgi:acyl-coenzyme A thioesterase PaaI-like protein